MKYVAKKFLKCCKQFEEGTRKDTMVTLDSLVDSRAEHAKIPQVLSISSFSQRLLRKGC